MAFMRSKTASSLKSQQWSTDEIGHGLMHILTDGRLELPDDAAQLQELEKQLADLEAKQACDAASAELVRVANVATPQASQKQPAVEVVEVPDTVPATEEEIRKSLSEPAPTSPALSHQSSLSLGASASGLNTSQAKVALIEMFKAGQVDAQTAMELLSGAMTDDPNSNSKEPVGTDVPMDNPENKRLADRKRSASPPSDDDDGQDDSKPSGALDTRSKNAMKAKLRRLCEEKMNGRLKVPQWLHDQWKSGRDRLEMAMNFAACGYDEKKFVKMTEKTVTTLETETNDVACGWYSKEDMKTTLKWNPKKIDGAIKVCESDPESLIRTCKYGGDEEYWVEVRETGKIGQEKQKKKEDKEISKDNDAKPSIGAIDTSKIDSMGSRKEAIRNGTSVQTSEAIRGKAVLTKFCDSVLQKSAKIRTLQADLRKNYPEDETAARSCTALDGDLTSLDSEYNKLSDLLAEGERDNFSKEWTTKSEKAMKLCQFMCTKIGQNESKIRNAKRHFKKLAKNPEGAK